MEKKYKLLIIIFLVIIIVGLSGFYKSYFSLFPTFNGLHILIHIHVLALLAWFVLTLWQPILIKQGKIGMHRKIGKFSYFLVAFIFVSVIVVSALGIRQELPHIKISKEEFYMQRFPGLFQGVLFTVYYIIAMISKGNIRLHVAFILAATLVVFTPSCGRLVLLFLPEQIGMPVVILIEFLMLIGIVIYEKIKQKKNVLKSPYLLIAGLLVVQTLIFVTVPQSKLWQTTMDKFANAVM